MCPAVCWFLGEKRAELPAGVSWPIPSRVEGLGSSPR